MKIKLYILGILSLAALSCTKQDINPNDDGKESITRAQLEEESAFYYYGLEDKKIFLQPVKDKIFLKFTADVTKDQFFSMVKSDISLSSMESAKAEHFIEGDVNYAVLELKERKAFRSRPLKIFWHVPMLFRQITSTSTMAENPKLLRMSLSSS